MYKFLTLVIVACVAFGILSGISGLVDGVKKEVNSMTGGLSQNSQLDLNTAKNKQFLKSAAGKGSCGWTTAATKGC